MCSRTALFLLTFILLASCSTSLTKAGANVRVVTESEREQYCEYLGIVTGSESNGIDSAGDARSAMNETRNGVAELGGHAMRIINIDSNEFQTTVVAEALRIIRPIGSERSPRD